MGSCELATEVRTSLNLIGFRIIYSSVELSQHSPVTMDIKVLYVCLFFIICQIESLVLLDPLTRHPMEVDFTPKNGFNRKVKTQNASEKKSSGIRRSDFISPSGTPLYKLRKRNPFGFGG